ncbi:MAG: MSMEG_0568 family radical SAM protein [Promethearchaeota archaeon]|nr:MAG: MSMEG_0568 family radical SAM protein [Candidatus Lokiarchaeota archaeon]
MIKNLAELKIELIAQGMRTSEGIEKGRRGGAGPAGGRFFRLKDGSCVNVPLWPSYTTKSPFELKNNKVLFNDFPLDEVQLIPIPQFYSKVTSDNIPMKKIALLHGSDCIASTIVQSCAYWRQNLPCKFCGIELSLQADSTTAVKTPRQVREVIAAAIEEHVCNHLTLTIGSLPRADKGTTIYLDIVREIKQYYDIPIHVQLEPPEPLQSLDDLHRSGVDTIGIHRESFDSDVLQDVCPGKIQLPLTKYIAAWKHAVQLFGDNQVDSYILVGLGESDSNILEGAKTLLELGVIPYIVPFRPILGTPLETHPTPNATRLRAIFVQIAHLLREYYIDPTKSKAGCVRCGGCSPLTEAFKYL